MSIEFPCQQCAVYLKVRDEDAGRMSRCPECQAETPVPFPEQKHIPARAGLNFGQRVGEGLKLYGFIFVISFVLMILFTPLSMIFLVALVMWLTMVGLGWAGTTLGMKLLYGNDPQYQQYRKAGGSPFWDSIWGSPKDYQLPYEEPSYDGGFVPPRSWGFQCLRCFARVEFEEGECWCCGTRLRARKKRFPMDCKS